MKTIATTAVLAIASMLASQAHAIELLVRVASTQDAVGVAYGQIGGVMNQISSIRLSPAQEPARGVVLQQLAVALNYEAAAWGALNAAASAAKVIQSTHPLDPKFENAVVAFDNYRKLAYQYTRTARAMTEQASNIARGYGLPVNLGTAVNAARTAESKALELNSLWIDSEWSDYDLGML
jgi:hypothetical protein